jgi:hypothetical protein
VSIAARDALARHLEATARVDWSVAPSSALLPPSDAHDRFVDGVDARRDPLRARRMRAALAQVRAHAAGGGALTWPVLRDAQALVLGRPVPMRRQDAFAKGGAERYAWTPDLERTFAAKLAADAADDLHVIARAARVYLDVCFFHPFEDGNARAARLAFEHVLHRAGVGVANLGPVFLVSRPAGDDAGYTSFLRLVTALATRRQPASSCAGVAPPSTWAQPRSEGSFVPRGGLACTLPGLVGINRSSPGWWSGPADMLTVDPLAAAWERACNTREWRRPTRTWRGRPPGWP